jgi:hypothetical protein
MRETVERPERLEVLDVVESPEMLKRVSGVEREQDEAVDDAALEGWEARH